MFLISGGCSFSECYSDYTKTWPIHLSRFLKCQHKSLALGSQGNGLIMRKLIHYIETVKHLYKDTLVAIMWSGPGRHDVFKSDIKNLECYSKDDSIMQNPTFIDTTHPGGWVITNHHWKDFYSKTYHDVFYDPIESQLKTVEYMLHTQWYLERKSIPYVMMCYTSHTLDADFLVHPEVLYLYKQLDLTKFADTTGCYEWCKENTNISFPEHDNHPNTEQHRLYTENVIIPHLKSRGII